MLGSSISTSRSATTTAITTMPIISASWADAKMFQLYRARPLDKCCLPIRRIAFGIWPKASAKQ